MAIGGELLLGPAIIVAGALAGLAMGYETVNRLEPITVTARMEEHGMTAEVVTKQLLTRLAQVTDIDTSFHVVGAKDMTGHHLIETIAEVLHVAPVVVATRRAFDAFEVEFEPNFVEREGVTLLELRIIRPQTGVRTVQEFVVKDGEVEPVLRKAARVMLGVVDPVALVIDDMRRHSYAAARDSLKTAEASVQEDHRHLTDLLHGIQALEDEDAAAAVKNVRYAIMRNPSFTPAQLALAVALARAGQVEKARSVLDDMPTPNLAWSDRGEREIEAGKHYIRGWLAMSEAEWMAARDEMKAALAIVPNFAIAHRALGLTYTALAMAPLAEYHERTARRLVADDVPRFDDRIDDIVQLVLAATHEAPAAARTSPTAAMAEPWPIKGS